VTHPAYRVYVSSTGNAFMTEIAEMVTGAIEASGREATLWRSGLPKYRPGVINLVVAPHEYFTLMKDVNERDIVRAAAQCVTIGVEQPGTAWFELGARYASIGPLAIDINPRGVGELRRRGLEVYRLAPGYYPGWDLWGGKSGTTRDRDVVFLGSLTDRRAQFLGESASVLTEWECDLRLFSGHQPVRQATPHFVLGRDKHALLASSRVLLNVHQGERDYFEWIRVLEAMTNGCVVVTESSGGYSPLVPDRHFIQGPLENLAGQLDAILRDEDLRTDIANTAYEFIQRSMDFTEGVDQLLSVIERRHHRDGFHTWRIPPPSSLDDSLRKDGPRPEFGPIGFAPSAEEIEYSAVEQIGAQVKLAVKDLMLAEVAEARSLESLISYLHHGSSEYARIRDTPAHSGATPEISVVITYYNYAEFIAEAVESVIASDGVEVELIVVDNHSNPDDRKVVEDLVESYSWFPIRLITTAVNRGPSGARNLGAKHARGEFIFLLDADNTVLPKGLPLLHGALTESGAAFAYGLLECFGAEGSVLSALPWDVDLLLKANYIDTMSLIRRSVWEELGGYDPQVDLMGGWDDYEFWLHLASAGYWGHLVTQFVGRYREHGTSWLSVANLNTNQFLEYLRTKHHQLPWPTEEQLP
jgi:GT2 family glycosyltransferase